MDSQEQFIDQAIEKVDNPERPEDDYFPIMSLPVEVKNFVYFKPFLSQFHYLI